MPAQDSFMSTLFSPPVMIIGAGIGLVILLMNSSSSVANAGVQTADPNVLSATVQMNQIAANSQVQLAQISAQSGAATDQVNLQSQGQVLGFLENISNNNAMINQTIATTQAGITNNQITTSASLAADINNNVTRLSLAQQQAQVSMDQTQAGVNIATIQANAAKSIATTNAVAGVLGNVISGASKVATQSFTGGVPF